MALNLVEISNEFLIFIDLKITETRFTPFHLLLLNKHFVRSLRATRAREHFKLRLAAKSKAKRMFSQARKLSLSAGYVPWPWVPTFPLLY